MRDARQLPLLFTVAESWPELTCEQCGEAYTRYPSQAKKTRFCSARCAALGRRKQQERACDWCGQTYRRKQSDVGRFCSSACAKAADSAQSRVELTCGCCGTIFIRRRCEATTYCSRACANAARRDPAKRAERACAQCGAVFSSYTAQGRRLCSRACEVAARTRPIAPEEVIRLYEEGTSVNALQARLGVDHRRLRAILQAAGVALRTAGEAQRGRTRGPQAPRAPTPCQACGAPMLLTPAEATGRKYCSKACNNKARVGKTVWTKPRPVRVAFSCPHCGSTIMLAPSKAKGRQYCSQTCARSNAGDKLRKPRPELVCKACGRIFTTRGKGVPHRTYCSHPCAMYDAHQRRRSTQARTLERLVGGLLEGMGIAFIPQWRFERCSADFYLTQFHRCIEADGDYWHRLPHAIKRDLTKERAYQAAGIPVLHITETEATDDILGCQRRILEFIGRTVGASPT